MLVEYCIRSLHVTDNHAFGVCVFPLKWLCIHGTSSHYVHLSQIWLKQEHLQELMENNFHLAKTIVVTQKKCVNIVPPKKILTNHVGPVFLFFFFLVC